MMKNEAIHVLEMIDDVYAKFDLSKTKADILIPKLVQMDYNGVMDKLAAHIMSHPYAPTLEEIAVYPPENNDCLDLVASWRKEATLVPEAVKRDFYQQIQTLVREKRHE